MKNELIGFDFLTMQPIGFELNEVEEIETHHVEIDGLPTMCVIVIVLENDVLMSLPDTNTDEMMELADKIAVRVMEARHSLN